MKKVAIICAGDDEVAPFLPYIKDMVKSTKAMLNFYEGTIHGVPVVTLYSGVCKVNAALATQILIDTYKVNIIINAGTAGGMDPSLNLFDTVISTNTVYHDVAEDILTGFHPWMKSIYFAADKDLLNIAKEVADNHENVYFGTIVTGEQFIHDDKRADIINEFNPLCVDMETAAIAHVAYVNEIPFIAIRSITDTADHAGIENFDLNCKQASKITKDVTVDILRFVSI